MTSPDWSHGKQNKKLNQCKIKKTPTKLVNVDLCDFVFNRRDDVILVAQANFNSFSNTDVITHHTYLDANAKSFFPKKCATPLYNFKTYWNPNAAIFIPNFYAIPNQDYMVFNQDYMPNFRTKLSNLNPTAGIWVPGGFNNSVL